MNRALFGQTRGNLHERKITLIGRFRYIYIYYSIYIYIYVIFSITGSLAPAILSPLPIIPRNDRAGSGGIAGQAMKRPRKYTLRRTPNSQKMMVFFRASMFVFYLKKNWRTLKNDTQTLHQPFCNLKPTPQPLHRAGGGALSMGGGRGDLEPAHS